MTRFVSVAMTLSLLAPSAQGQAPAVRVDSITSATVTEVKGSSGMGTWTLKAEKGVIVEVRARLALAAQAKFSAAANDCMLSGASKIATQSSTWNLSTTAVGLQTGKTCNYTNPSSIVKGAMSQSNPMAGTFEVAREQEGGPAMLTFGPGSTKVCFAFLVPAGPAGAMKLKLGQTAIAVPAVAAK
jgi:hypothetical protein